MAKDGESRVHVLHRARGRLQELIVEEDDCERRLKILSERSGEWQSRMDLREPSRLVAAYTRAMMLALLWRPAPSRAHVLGLGGGRIPVFLRRRYPALTIDCTEIDPDIHDVAIRFFGFRPDPRMQVHLEDGREFLRRRGCPSPEPAVASGGKGYDIIFVDAFCGTGHSPVRLSSTEFLETCRANLAPGGIIALNMTPGDPLERSRLAAVEQVFQSAYIYRGEEALVAFGALQPWLPLGELLDRAARAASRSAGAATAPPLSFLSTLARSLTPLVPVEPSPPELASQSDPATSSPWPGPTP